MKIVISLFLGLVFTCAGVAQGNLKVRTQPDSIRPGQTLLLEATYLPATGSAPKFATLHVWLEDLGRNRRWKLRYPIVDGVATAGIELPDSLPSGVYGLSCQVQREMVHLMGHLKNKKPPSQINVLAQAADSGKIVKTVSVDEGGYFQMPALLFEDKATFVFSPTGKTTTNWLDVELEAPADSVFFSLADFATKIAVGVSPSDTARVTDHPFGRALFNDMESTLQNVVVIARAKTEVQKFEEQYVGGFFTGDGTIFDGLDDTQITSSTSVLDFLTARVAGLDIVNDRLDGSVYASWRGFEPVYFIDEVQTDNLGIQSLSTSEIAMIKVIRPPFYGVSMGSAGGAIAVYTKKGGSTTGKYGNRFRFVVTGYTPQIYKLIL